MGYIMMVLSVFLAFILGEGPAHKPLQRERLAVSTAKRTGFSVSTGPGLMIAASGAGAAFAKGSEKMADSIAAGILKG